MKNIVRQLITGIASFTILLSTPGCKKYTEVEPVSQYSLPQAFSDVSNATTALVGVYDDLMGDNAYGIRVNLYYPYDSDEGIVSGNIDNGRRGIGRYQLLLTNAELRNPFVQLYRGIERANLCIEQIPLMKQYNGGTSVEQKELRRLYAEALTLRAQYYFELIRNWGDVPAPMIPAYRQIELFIPRANRDSTYDLLLADLAVAKDLLPWRTETALNERVTKGAAKALRAKIAMFRGGYSLRGTKSAPQGMLRRADYLTYYQIAKDECAEIIARADQHTLNPSFESVWKNYLCNVSNTSTDPFGEIIWQAGAGGGNANSDSRMGNYNGPSVNAASRYGTGGGGLLCLPNLFYAFDSTDTRRDVSVTLYAVGSATNIKGVRRLGELTDGKFRRDWRNPLLPGSVLNVGYNWPFIRFSDVLLMYAEASNEIGNGPSATDYSYVNMVRRRAYGKPLTTADPLVDLPAGLNKATFFDAIVNERFLEFAGEGIRKYDLIRWNLLATKIAETRTKIQQLRDRTGAYVNVPRYLFWRNNGEEVQYAFSFYKTTALTALTGWTRMDWSQHLSSNLIDGLQLDAGIARFFQTGKSELFPFDQTTLDSYQGKLEQNPGY